MISRLLAASCAVLFPLSAAAKDMTQARLEKADAESENWLHVNGNYAAHRYAALDQINRARSPSCGSPCCCCSAARRPRPAAYNPNVEVQTYNSGTAARRGGIAGVFCPAVVGGKNWEPSAYSPRRQTVFVSSGEGCTGGHATAQERFEGRLDGTAKRRTTFTGRTSAPASVEPPPLPVAAARRSLNIVDVATGAVRAKVMQASKTYGLLATAGDLVVGGDKLGDVTAYDAATLQALWSFNVGTAIQAPPMAFAYQGRQFIAILAGGTAGAPEREQRPGARWFSPSNYLFVFSL